MTDPLPRRITWFAPWTWTRRWKLALAAVALVGLYMVTATIIMGRCEVCGKAATLVHTFKNFDSPAVTHRYCEEHRILAPP